MRIATLTPRVPTAGEICPRTSVPGPALAIPEPAANSSALALLGALPRRPAPLFVLLDLEMGGPTPAQHAALLDEVPFVRVTNKNPCGEPGSLDSHQWHSLPAGSCQLTYTVVRNFLTISSRPCEGRRSHSDLAQQHGLAKVNEAVNSAYCSELVGDGHCRRESGQLRQDRRMVETASWQGDEAGGTIQ